MLPTASSAEGPVPQFELNGCFTSLDVRPLVDKSRIVFQYISLFVTKDPVSPVAMPVAMVFLNAVCVLLYDSYVTLHTLFRFMASVLKVEGSLL